MKKIRKIVYKSDNIGTIFEKIRVKKRTPLKNEINLIE